MSKKINETKIYGENACLALFKNRPEDIIQVFVTKEKLKVFLPIIKFCTQNKKAYHLVSRPELEKMTKAIHHEDICMLVKEKKMTAKNLDLTEYLKTKPKTSLLLALENVSNPHNIGAILRTSAHFGVDGLILSDATVARTAAAIRTSEGGSEHTAIYEETHFVKAIDTLIKNGFQVITTSSHAKKSLYELEWNPKTVILLGEEATGLSKEIIKKGTVITIPGTGAVESLNVSVAAGIILSDYFLKKGL